MFVAAFACACVAAAAPSGPIFFPGREYGLGEHQTYLIDRNSTLTLHLSGSDGQSLTKTIAAVDESSVAFTVEGYNDAGMPVLGIASAHRVDRNATTGGPPATASPVIENDGSVRSESFAEFAPAAALLNGLDANALDIGTTWNGRGDLMLPFARAALRLRAQVNFKSGEAKMTLLQALLTGDAGVSGHPNVAPFGAVRLAGGGALAGNAYISPERRLLLGMDLTMMSNGNVTDSRSRHGTYTLVAHWSIKLAGYASGPLPGPGISPGIGIPVTQMGAPAPGATNVFSQGTPADVFHPASISPDVIDKTNSSAPPTAAPSPDESLPPVPILVPSDQPVVSPPPGPSPTPS
jgi:hypothetical protein